MEEEENARGDEHEACGDECPDAETVEWSGEFAGPVSLSVDQEAPGPVTVTGWDRGEVQVKAFKRLRAGSAESARRLLEEAEVNIDAEGERVRIETRLPRPLISWGAHPRGSIELRIMVPVGSATDIDCGSGRVEVGGTLGQVNVDSGSGSVTVTRAAGGVNVDSGSGSIVVEESRGDVELDVGSGSIKVFRVEGDIEIDGSSGSVSVREVTGKVSVDTASGSVALTLVTGDIFIDTGSGGVKLEQVKGENVTVDTGSGGIRADFDVADRGRYRFDTGSGRISLTVPDEASFTVTAETGSGRIDCQAPVATRRAGRRHLEGVAGDGSARIEAETSSGSIVIRTRSGLTGDGAHSWGYRRGGGQGRGDDQVVVREYRAAVLKMVQEGKITADQAVELLSALGAGADGATTSEKITERTAEASGTTAGEEDSGSDTDGAGPDDEGRGA